MTNISERHYSAFGGEINKYFDLTPGKTFLDLTLGDGGHTEQALRSGCKVFSFDVDPQSIQRSVNYLSGLTKPLILTKQNQVDKKLLSNYQWIILEDNFINFASRLSAYGIEQVDNILIDLGPSQNQILNNERGFSFDSDAMLDMRIDPTLAVTAKDLVNGLNEGELRELFLLVDEGYAKPIARIICKLRQNEEITTCKQLASIVSKIKRVDFSHTHPATKVFMALRMAVNSERENIRQVINQIPNYLSHGGIAGIITFHSGEDKLVKELFADLINTNTVIAINKKPIEPSEDELKISKRTRSAKLRLIKKC